MYYYIATLLNTSGTDVAVVLNKTEENDMDLEAHTEANSTGVIQTYEAAPLWSVIEPVTFLLIMVSVQPEEFSAHQCIWNTWYHGFSDSEVVMMKFAIGIKALRKEPHCLDASICMC